MKKLITAIVLIGMLVSVNTSYGGLFGDKAKAKAKAKASAEIGDITNNNKNTNVNANLNVNANKNTNKNINVNKNTNLNVNVNKNKQQQGQLQGQMQGQMQGQKQDQDQNQGQGQSQSSNNVNEGNKNSINISDNSVYTDIHSTDLLNPGGYVPLADRLFKHDMHISKSIFDLQRNVYNYKELTRFANPGRFLGFLWPEWENKYHIEIATFAKHKAKRTIQILPAGIVRTLGLTKIGEGQAYAKDLNKSEHQVMAAAAFRAAQAGATVIVFKSFSNPLVKVDSFVIGGGGTQVGSPQSVFNGAAGIGTSSSETLTRAGVLIELYR